MVAATIGIVAVGSRWFRKRCPMCGKRAVVERAGVELDRAVAPPTAFWQFECAACHARFASGDGRTLIPKDAWDAGVRGSFSADARVVPKDP